MKTLKLVAVLLGLVNRSLTIPVATSHQSIVSGDGYSYSYGIVHGPPGIGHAVGESFPHGYGGFGTYAPAYGYGGYGLGQTVPALLPHTSVAPIPVVSKSLVPLAHIPIETPKAVTPLPVISKPINIPFEEYVLSSPENSYGYGVPHYGLGYGDGLGFHHLALDNHAYGYEHHHHGYGDIHSTAPGYGITHLSHTLYDDHLSGLGHYDGYLYGGLYASGSPYGYGGFSSH